VNRPYNTLMILIFFPILWIGLDIIINCVSNVIKQAGVRTRAIERKLRDVEALPASSEFEDEGEFDSSVMEG